MRNVLISWFLGVCVLAVSGAAGAAPSYEVVTELGGPSEVVDQSADGSIIVSFMPRTGDLAFWDATSGWASVVGSYVGGPVAISGDGSTVVGWMASTSPPAGFVYTTSGGFVFPSGIVNPTAVTADGSTIFGWNSSDELVSWTAATGVTVLASGFPGTGSPAVWPTLMNGYTSYHDLTLNRWLAASANGDVVASGNQVWTATGGVTTIEPPGWAIGPHTRAAAVSADGSTVVGGVTDMGPAFSWTASGGVRFLEPLPDGPATWIAPISASGVSADGSAIVGMAYGGGLGVFFLWTEQTGAIYLYEYLADLFGSYPPDWQTGFMSSITISDDGQTLLTVAGERIQLDDADYDAIANDADNCPNAHNPGQEDGDGDGVGDACDTCPLDAENDADGDGVCGDVDNCPYAANAGQEDTGGVASPSDPSGVVVDGVGDACQCGDVTDDGRVNGIDSTIIARSMIGLPPGMTSPEKCSVFGTVCNYIDSTVIVRTNLGLPPGIQQVCEAALP